LAGVDFHDVSGQPDFADVAAEGLASAGEVGEPALGNAGFGTAPCTVGVTFVAEGAR
jgi:hypothetical protein